MSLVCCTFSRLTVLDQIMMSGIIVELHSRGAFIKCFREMFGIFIIKKRFHRIRTEKTERFLVLLDSLPGEIT